jgi:methyl-accepting chemotaxis protein
VQLAVPPEGRPPSPYASPSALDTPEEELDRAISELDLLNKETEHDFLKLGGKLSEFMEESAAISSRLTSLVKMIAGEDGLNTARSLQAAFDCFAEMRAHHASRGSKLSEVSSQATGLKKTLGGFREIVTNLRSIGVMTRVEISRLGEIGSSFGTLSKDMTYLTENVQAKVESALDTGTQLIEPIEEAVRDIAALGEKQVRGLSDAFSNLSAFGDIQASAHDSSEKLRNRYGATANAFKDLIVSIQFHDMTRQQVEHVAQVLRRLRVALGPDSDHNSREYRLRQPVLVLQSAQLAGAAEKFAASVNSIVQRLDEITLNIGEMAAESRTLSGASEDRKASYFLQMEHGCSEILDRLKQLMEADAAVRDTTSGLEQNIDRMRQAVEEIRRMEIQIRKMAMNATIVATRIGCQGDTVHALAIAMREQAAASETHSKALLRSLDLLQEVALLAEQTGTATGGSHDDYMAGMLKAVAELHTSGERSVSRIADIVASAASLHRELSAVREFSAGQVFASAITGVRARLLELENKAPSRFQFEGMESMADGLLDFGTHYTMQAERDVHERVTGFAVGAAVVAQAKQSHIPSQEAEELGDNVDFF